jgi:hypothetical protein
LFTGFGVLGFAEAVGAAHTTDMVAAIVWVSTCWLLALAADARERALGDAARIAAVGVLAYSIQWSGVDALVPSLVLLVAAFADGARQGRREIMIAAAIPVVHVQFVLADLAELRVEEAGVACAIAASVWVGLAALARDLWRVPLFAAGAVSAVAGVIAAAGSNDTLGPALFVTGGVALACGLLFDQSSVVHAGALVATAGAWITLATNGVAAAELYAAPVALHLLGSGFVLRRAATARPSSWIAYGPGLALACAAAVIERLGGGSANHSIVAGAIAIVAVIAGGSFRLAAPLLIGTTTLVVVVGRETFDTAAGIPTWAWLAAGGATLIGAAVAMERHDVGPVEAGRRVVDVLDAHFE